MTDKPDAAKMVPTDAEKIALRAVVGKEYPLDWGAWAAFYAGAKYQRTVIDAQTPSAATPAPTVADATHRIRAGTATPADFALVFGDLRDSVSTAPAVSAPDAYDRDGVAHNLQRIADGFIQEPAAIVSIARAAHALLSVSAPPPFTGDLDATEFFAGEAPDDVAALIARLEGYNPPDRVFPNQRPIAEDIASAAAMLRKFDAERRLSAPAGEDALPKIAKKSDSLLEEVMSNMSHCRFQNTLGDLRDCWNNMDEPLSSGEEVRARREIIKICCSIAEDYADELATPLPKS